MLHLWNRMSLRTRVLLQAGIVIVLLFLAVALFSDYALRKSTSQALAERLLIAEHTARRLDFVLDQSLLQMERHFPPGLALTDAGLVSSRLQKVYSELPLSPAYTAVVDRQGKLLHTEPELPQLKELPTQTLRDVLERGDAVVTGLLPDLRGQVQAIYLISPIKDEAGTIQGLSLAAIDPNSSNLSDFLQPLSLGSTGFAEVADREGMVLATTQGMRLLQKDDHAEQFALLIDRGKTTMGTCHSCHQPAGGQKGREVLAFAPLERAPWGIAIRQSEGEALAPARALQRQFFFLGMAALGGVLLLSWSASRQLATSAQRLQRGASQIALGDLETPIPKVAGAEMIRLAEALERMRQELQESRQEIERWNRELEEKVAARTRELMSLVQASEALVSTAGPETLLDSVVSIAARTFRADGAIMFLWDARQGRLVARAANGYDLGPLALVALQPGEGVAGKVFKTGEAALTQSFAEVEEKTSA